MKTKILKYDDKTTFLHQNLIHFNVSLIPFTSFCNISAVVLVSRRFFFVLEQSDRCILNDWEEDFSGPPMIDEGSVDEDNTSNY